MTTTATYAVLLGPGKLELRECGLPEIPADGGLLRVEANGVCGSDVDLFTGRRHAELGPVVPGHEPFGIVERLGKEASAIWGIEEGDRVAVLAVLQCGRCVGCRSGSTCAKQRPGETRAYGFRSADLEPPLWGGMATHLFLSPEVRLVPVSSSLPIGVASLYNAMANGVEWAVTTGGARPGSRVVVLGPGPRGLACLVAARFAGAAHVTVAGLHDDADRLELARDLGADAVVSVAGRGVDEMVESVGTGADLVIDTTPGSVVATEAALAIARLGGTVVVAGFKGTDARASVDVDAIIKGQLTVRSGFSKNVESTRIAIDILERGGLPFDRWASHAYPLADALAAVDAASGTLRPGGERATHVRIEPWL